VAGSEEHILAAVDRRASPASSPGNSGEVFGESSGSGRSGNAADQAATDQTKLMEAVEPVEVDSVAAIEPTERNQRNEPAKDRSSTEQQRGPSDTAQASSLSDALRQLEQTIRETLQREWGLAKE